MTDNEMIENLKCVIEDLKKQYKELEAENAELKREIMKEQTIRVWAEKDAGKLYEENAKLRERLKNSVEFPRVEQSPYNGMFNGLTVNDDTLLYYIEDNHIKQECFNNKFPSRLQKRLAELKGETSEQI